MSLDMLGHMLAKMVADAIQPMMRDVHMLKSAFSSMVKEGTVEESDANKGYRIKLGEGDDGPYLSGWVPHPETGKTSIPLKKDQRVALLSPGGDLSQAMLIRTGYSDAHQSPNSNMEANVFEDAGVKVEVADGKTTVTIGGATFVQSADGLVMTVGGSTFTFSGDGMVVSAGGTSFSFTGAGFTQMGGMQMHDGKDVGQTHTNAGLPVD